MTNRTIVLAGTHVALAEMTLEDQPLFHAWLQSQELRELIDDPRVPSIRDQAAWFQRVQKPDRKFFSIVEMPSQTVVGNGGFVDIGDAPGEATLRITIGNPDARGKGLGTEAVILLTRYGFETAGWRRINLHVLKTNERAIRSYEKVGFAITSERLEHGKTVFTMTLNSPIA